MTKIKDKRGRMRQWMENTFCLGLRIEMSSLLTVSVVATWHRHNCLHSGSVLHNNLRQSDKHLGRKNLQLTRKSLPEQSVVDTASVPSAARQTINYGSNKTRLFTFYHFPIHSLSLVAKIHNLDVPFSFFGWRMENLCYFYCVLMRVELRGQ